MVAENIKHLREIELDLSRKEFGAKINVSADVINNWERGRVNVPESAIQLMCYVYGVSERWLRTGEGEMFVPGESDLIDELARKYNVSDVWCAVMRTYIGMNAAQRRAIDDYITALAAELPRATPYIDTDAEGKTVLHDPQLAAEIDAKLAADADNAANQGA